MLLSLVATTLASALALVDAAPAPRAVQNKIIGYHESWYWYNSPGNQPLQFTSDLSSRYTHINYAFATIHFHEATKQFFVGFTDAWADYQGCVGTSCPSECIKLPTDKLCSGGKVSLVPYLGANGTCPDTACYNPSGVPGSPRRPQCEAVLDPNGLQYDWTTTPATPYLCGNYAYVLNKVKKQAPGLKFLISLGGWYDSNLFSAATEPQYIDAFVTSIVKFVEFFGFDGVDFDWEYPGWEHGAQPPFKGGAPGAGSADGMTDCSKATCGYAGRTNDMAKFNALVTKTRAGLKAIGKTKTGEDYLVSMAAPAGYDKMNKLDIKTICQQLDFINIMTYDIHGEWESNTNHQAPLYDNTPPQYKPTNGVPDTSVDFAVEYWIKNGCPANQIVVGVPFYAHAWKAADGGSKGLFQPGTPSSVTKLNYVDLAADASIQTYWDEKAQASYGYSAAQGTFYSFDTPQAISAKVGYGVQKGLGGFMVWPIAGDDAKGLLKALTGSGSVPPPPPASSSTTAAPKPTTLTTTTTVPVQASSTFATTTTTTTTLVPSKTTTTTTTSVAIPTTSASSDCYPAWSSAAPYNGGAKVSYGGVNYVAKWWAGQSDVPGKADMWNAAGSCGNGPVVSDTTTTTTTQPPKTSTVVQVTTSAPVPITTTTQTGGSPAGQPCGTNGATTCAGGVTYLCAYYASSTLTYAKWYDGGC
ncbi:UNVERIFIED_CONTAM: hypothetical protein HDU68_011469 [Siphonaria sp. JEL0065]|nr:hypothetical protein HDU68_011469 [Siphonaria sp. JEL0065]